MHAMTFRLDQPLRLRPRLVPKMWGGRSLQEYGKSLPVNDLIGESWEVYDFPPGVVAQHRWSSAELADADGATLHDLMTDAASRADLLGDAQSVSTPHGPQFPLLIKFLDAADDLSVQVHPDEAYATLHPDAHLKNEAWFVLRHGPEARLLKGLKPGVDRHAFERGIRDGTVESLICGIPARVGECHYLPSGTVHALGAGMLVAEVQTPSDTTYRVFDFNRRDPSTGNPRELHVEQALACIDFDGRGPTAPTATSGTGRLVTAPQFTLSADAGQGDTLPDGVAVLVVTNGTIRLGDVTAGAGSTLLIAAACRVREVSGDADAAWLVATPA